LPGFYSPLDGVLAASYYDSQAGLIWKCDRYRGGWRRKLHPTAGVGWAYCIRLQPTEVSRLWLKPNPFCC